MKEIVFKCKKCGAEVSKKDTVCPNCSERLSKPFYQKWWVWTIAVIIIIGFASSNSVDNSSTPASTNSTETQKTQFEASTQQRAESSKSEPKTEEPSIPTEYKSALKKAKSYSDIMHMSKKGVYDQLTSEYGEKFSAEAAQYAVDNLEADWKANALAKAKSYQETMSMSPEAIRDQLTSEYGEKFTAEEANYAIENLN